MSDNISYTPGTGGKMPAKELTHSGDTVLAQIVELGLDNGSALTRVQGGRNTAANSIPMVHSTDQASRLYSKVAFGSIPSSFTTILDPTAGPIKLGLIDGINKLNTDVEITFGASSSALLYVPAGATFEENLAELGLSEATIVKYKYVTAPSSGYFVIRGIGI